MSEWILEVSDLNEYVRQVLLSETVLRRVRLRGEISNFKRHSSGHWYFTLKDSHCRIAAVMFRQNAMRMSVRPQDGMSVIVSGQVGLYSEGGTYQITCDSMRPDGVGSLYQQFERLKARLQEEGLFDAERKRPLPFRPRRIAIVTSQTGAVLHDIRMVAMHRDPSIPLVLVPVQVQGQTAAADIVRGIMKAARLPEVDVIIVGRGGGSMEDLWAFNEEEVARAIAACPVPVISAVGHETDVTIADFVADRRAATPSNAAEIAVPDRKEVLDGLEGMRYHLYQAAVGALQARHMQILSAQRRLAAAHPQERLGQMTRHTQQLQARMQLAVQQRLNALTPRVQMASIRMENAAEQAVHAREEQLHRAMLRLKALNPNTVLERGYALVLSESTVLPDKQRAMQHNPLTLRFRDGEMQVTRLDKEAAHGDEEETTQL